MTKFINKIKCICLDILSTWQYIRRCTESPEFFFFTLFFHFWLQRCTTWLSWEVPVPEHMFKHDKKFINFAQHLESYPPGINRDVYIHVWSMYKTCMYYSIVHTRLIHVHTFMEIYRHVYTFLLIYKHVCTWYRHVCAWKGTNMYVHRSDVYVHVYTSIYAFWLI